MKVETCFVRRLMVFVYYFYGLWRTADTSLMYNFYGCALHIFFTFIYTITMCARLVQLTDLAEVMSASGMTFTLIALSVKVLSFVRFLPKIQIIMRNCEEFDLKDPKETQLVASRMQFFSIIAYCYLTMANTAGITQYVSGWWTRQMPFAAWFPFIDAQKYYLLIYTYQVLGMIMMSAVNIVMELFPSYLMYSLSVQTEVICRRMEDLANDGINTEPYHIVTRSLLQQGRIKLLKECIKMHQQLCR